MAKPTIYETEIVENGGLKYKIQVRYYGGIWQQRHIWYPAPATFVTKKTTDEWIKGVQVPPGHNYKPVRVRS